MNIPGFNGMAVRDVARRMFEQAQEDDILTYGASLAFHAMLALFPFAAFMLAVVTFFDMPQLLERAIDWAGTVLPSAATEQVSSALRNFHNSRDTGLLSFGAAGAIWAASGGVRSAMKVLNRAYDVTDSRPLWKRVLLSVVYTLGLMILLLAGAGLMLVGPGLMGWIAQQAGLGDTVLTVWKWGRYPVAVVALMIAGAIVYSLFPNTDRFRWITPGSVFAVLLWILLSFAFRLYISNFARYDALYGSIGAVIVLMLYLWLSAIVLLAGAELNAVVERRGAPRRSTGSARVPDQPPG